MGKPIPAPAIASEIVIKKSHRKKVKPKQTVSDVFYALSFELAKNNPTIFSLPDCILDHFPTILKNPRTGQYIDAAVTGVSPLLSKPQYTRRSARSLSLSLPNKIVLEDALSESEADPIQPHEIASIDVSPCIPLIAVMSVLDDDGPPRCFACNKTSTRYPATNFIGCSSDVVTTSPLVACDHCSHHWHLDCLSPPRCTIPHELRESAIDYIEIYPLPSWLQDGLVNASYCKPTLLDGEIAAFSIKPKWMCPLHAPHKRAFLSESDERYDMEYDVQWRLDYDLVDQEGCLGEFIEIVVNYRSFVERVVFDFDFLFIVCADEDMLLLDALVSVATDELPLLQNGHSAQSTLAIFCELPLDGKSNEIDASLSASTVDAIKAVAKKPKPAKKQTSQKTLGKNAAKRKLIDESNYPPAKRSLRNQKKLEPDTQAPTEHYPHLHISAPKIQLPIVSYPTDSSAPIQIKRIKLNVNSSPEASPVDSAHLLQVVTAHEEGNLLLVGGIQPTTVRSDPDVGL